MLSGFLLPVAQGISIQFHGRSSHYTENGHLYPTPVHETGGDIKFFGGNLVPLYVSLHPYLKSHTTRFISAALGWGEEEFFESVWPKSTSPRLGQMGGGCTFSEPSTLWHLWSPVVLGPQAPVSGSPTCSEPDRLLSRQQLLRFWLQSLSLFPDSSVFFFSGHARSIFSIVSISLLLHWIWNSVSVLEERGTYTSSVHPTAEHRPWSVFP